MSTDRVAAMEVFVRVVDAGSFSAAAAQLGIGQPAVSKTIAQLEERLGVQLMVRSTRNLSLTDAGRRFCDNAKKAIDGVNHAERVARGDGGIAGTLRVSASICFSRIHVMPRLPEFFAQHPGVDIEIVANDRFVNLAEERMDLALRTGRLTDSSLTVRRIGQARARVMATASYWKAHGSRRRQMTYPLTSASSFSATPDPSTSGSFARVPSNPRSSCADVSRSAPRKGCATPCSRSSGSRS